VSSPDTKERGVSPVIGVMLMIVVTIIIAAVVSAFAGGLTGEQKKVPVAQFDLRLYYSLIQENSGGSTFDVGGETYYTSAGHAPQFVVTMKSGEPIPGKDLNLVTYRTLADGTVQKYEFDATNTSQYKCSGGKGTMCLDVGYISDGWANSMVYPGRTFHTATAYVDKVLGPGVSNLSEGDSIEVNIVHKPTNTIIYRQEVTVI